MEWGRCIETSRYFQYGDSRKQTLDLEEISASLTWNQQQCESVRNRIKAALADLLNQNALPSLTTARFKAITSYGISGSSLYRHKDLWHPDFLNSPEPEQPDQEPESSDPANSSTSLFPSIDCNPASELACSCDQPGGSEQTDCNRLIDLGSGDLALSESLPESVSHYELPVFKPP